MPFKIAPTVLGALEAHGPNYRAATGTRHSLTVLFERVLSAWLYPGAEIDIHDRTKVRPRCLVIVRVGSGNSRGASRFRIVGKPVVNVDDSGDPELSRWSVRAVAISSKTGKDISGNTPNRRTTTDGTVTLTGDMFAMGQIELMGAAYVQLQRDQFVIMVAQAEAIHEERATARRIYERVITTGQL